MTDIGFYHLTRTPLEKTLPRLLEKILAAGYRVVVQGATVESVESLNSALWTYSTLSFLPHGTARTGRPNDQPIWLTHLEENPNGSKVLALVQGAVSTHVGDYEKVVYMFDGNDSSTLAQAREYWKSFKDQGHNLVYWQQTDSGSWVQKS